MKDRPGHDFRYALNCKKIKKEIKWKVKKNIDEGLFYTIKWYCENKHFLNKASKKQLSKRLGLNI